MVSWRFGKAFQQVMVFVPHRLHSPAKAFARERGLSERDLYAKLLEPSLAAIAAGKNPLPEEPTRAA